MKKSKKRYFLIILILVAAILIVFGAKIYLTVNLLLGNDIVVSLNSDNESIFLKHGESADIEFSTSVTANIFCESECSSEFTDLSRNKTLEKDSFKLKSIGTNQKKYSLSASEEGYGQEIYRFDVKCKSIATALCHTESEKERTAIVILNYGLNDEEETIKSNEKANLTYFIEKLDYMDFILSNLNISIINMNKTIENNFYEELKAINEDIKKTNEYVLNLKQIFENSSYGSIKDYLPETKNNISLLENKTNKLNSNVNSDILAYNNLVSNIILINNNLKEIAKINISNSEVNEINSAESEFSNITSLFIQRNSIQYKSSLILNFSAKLSELKIKINESNETKCCFASEMSNISVDTIKIQNENFTQSEIIFKKPFEKCCLFGKCMKCCDDECKNNTSLYPVILLHGHAFNKGTSAEYSLDTFQEIQKALENESYISTGPLLISSENEKVWGKINYPITVRASHYFDIYKNPGKDTIIQTKTDNIDSYAIKLKDIIDVVREKTNRDKVIIVAHSMGGLVARRYIQVFGSENVEKMILMATPNQGINDNILSYCKIFGSSLECNDMSKESLFINKLENWKYPDIKIDNIQGIGCQMGNETGDGIATKENSFLENADNYIIEGKCEGSNLFHGEMLNPSKYPEIFQTLVQLLKK